MADKNFNPFERFGKPSKFINTLFSFSVFLRKCANGKLVTPQENYILFRVLILSKLK